MTLLTFKMKVQGKNDITHLKKSFPKLQCNPIFQSSLDHTFISPVQKQ